MIDYTNSLHVFSLSSKHTSAKKNKSAQTGAFVFLDYLRFTDFLSNANYRE